LKLLNGNGAVLDASFHIEQTGQNQFRIDWESRGGSDHGPRSSRNKDYAPALEELLRRMALNNIRIDQVYIASRKESWLPADERRIEPKGFAYPIDPGHTDVRELRLAIGRALAAFGQDEGVIGGNMTKRMSLDLSWPGAGRPSIADFEDALLAAEGSAEAERHRGLKYKPLGDFLAAQTAEEVVLTLSDIEALVGGLPAKATTHQFWANAKDYHTSRRSQWLDNGFEATFLPRAATVKFARQIADEEPTDDPEELERRVQRKLRKLKKLGQRTPPPPGNRKPPRTNRGQSSYVRDPNVVAWVLSNNGQRCECCERDAPFQRDDGSPFLEVHHVRPLSEGGPDTTDNAVACCPNCHREMHAGRERETLRIRVIGKTGRLIDHPRVED
jgi:5-methylcytosine-specific restriction protein A